MPRRGMLRAGVAIGACATFTLGLCSAANASPAGFVAKYVHAGGTGALAVESTGGISWFNRSVTLTSVKVYANAGECGDFLTEAFSGSKKVYSTSYGEFCGGTTGAWTSIGNIPLDGSDYPGGITRVWIQVRDKLHAGTGFADCYRADSTCLQDQA